MKKKFWKLAVVIAVLLTIGIATVSVSAEEEDFPSVYSVVVSTTLR